MTGQLQPISYLSSRSYMGHRLCRPNRLAQKLDQTQGGATVRVGLNSGLSDGVQSWYISTEHDGAEWAIGVDLVYAAPPGDAEILPPIRLHSLIFQPIAEAARWSFPDPILTK
ncbi:hypothetical protein BDN72DRAFT_964947 [Pluteus cervinus]|uniref:Uncharacterized protein n=1 Tax=Pluteus cervinus TaxID=181527 RepID=A0ACD3AAI2_9AGAR|nr:hypothetical protein BDN72DRAFT_964947 [Pluteus cervinus]